MIECALIRLRHNRKPAAYHHRQIYIWLSSLHYHYIIILHIFEWVLTFYFTKLQFAGDMFTFQLRENNAIRFVDRLEHFDVRTGSDDLRKLGGIKGKVVDVGHFHVDGFDLN